MYINIAIYMYIHISEKSNKQKTKLLDYENF
mgnify:CR=1 FL=1